MQKDDTFQNFEIIDFNNWREMTMIQLNTILTFINYSFFSSVVQRNAKKCTSS